MKLTFTHTITEKRDFGKTVVTQHMDVTVEYDTSDDSISDPIVVITEGGCSMEVSKLLDKAEGNPLNTILEAINWREVYEGSETFILKHQMYE